MLNIKVNTTALNSPFLSGLCEKNHVIVDNMIEKLEFENSKIPFNDLYNEKCHGDGRGVFAVPNCVR